MNYGTFLTDGKSYKYSNGFIYKWETTENYGEIYNTKSDIIYRGNLNIENENLDTAYINIINYETNAEHKIMIKQMEELSDNVIVIKDNVIVISFLPLNSIIQIVAIPPYEDSDFNTNKVEIEMISNEDPIYITIPKTDIIVNYIIWIDNMCKRINI